MLRRIICTVSSIPPAQQTDKVGAPYYNVQLSHVVSEFTSRSPWSWFRRAAPRRRTSCGALGARGTPAGRTARCAGVSVPEYVSPTPAPSTMSWLHESLLGAIILKSKDGFHSLLVAFNYLLALDPILTSATCKSTQLDELTRLCKSFDLLRYPIMQYVYWQHL